MNSKESVFFEVSTMPHRTQTQKSVEMLLFWNVSSTVVRSKAMLLRILIAKDNDHHLGKPDTPR